MNTFWNFLIESGISLSILYLFYFFFLKRDTWYGRNRWFLLLSIIFSMALPFIHIQLKSETPELLRSFVFQEAITTPSGSVVQETHSVHPALLIYLSGVMFTLGILVFRILQIVILAFRFSAENKGTFRLVRIPGNRPAFSFFKWVFLPSNLNKADEEKIIAHEIIHINCHHTVDLLITELLCVFQWFNPLTWLYKFSLKEIHEYSADNHALSGGINRLSYQKLILKQIFGIELFPLGNHFNKSLIKKRMIMMTKNKSPKISHLKLLATLPVVLTLIFFLSCSKNEKESQNEPSQMEQQGPIASKESPNKLPQVEQQGKIFTIVEEMPTFQGKGQEGFRVWLVKHMKYPEIAAENGISGRVFVNFVVETDGSVSNVKIIRGANPSLDAEAIRVVQSSPKWTPGKQRGKEVRVVFTFPINFVLQ